MALPVQQSIDLLHKLTSPFGIQASLSEEGNYRAVFTRDAVLVGLAGLIHGDEIVTEAFIRSVKNLQKTQLPQGQIASNFQFNSREITKVSYGTLSLKTDACTLYAIGVLSLIQEGHLIAEEWEAIITKTFQCLQTLEYNDRHLIYVPQGGNWADEYPYEGYLLFDQTLRYWALKLAAKVYDNVDWQAKAASIRQVIKLNFLQDEEEFERYHPVAYQRMNEEPIPYYLSGFSPVGYHTFFDLAANALAAIQFPGPESKRALEWAEQTFEKQTAGLPPVFWPVIDSTHPQWQSISNYFLYVFKNQPHHYHNGGIWWIWLGWLTVAYEKNGMSSAAEKIKKITSQMISDIGLFEFDEYLNSRDFMPGGTKKMAYTATGILLMHHAEKASNIF